MKRLLFLVLLVGGGYLLWTERDRVLTLVGRDQAIASAEPERPSEGLAEMAAAKLENLKNGHVESVSFNQLELQSLLQFKFVQLLPAFVDSPQVELKNDRINVKAWVPVENLPSLSELGDAAGFLPDTTEVSMSGHLLPLDSGRVALAIDQVRAARIPLPKRLVPRALQRLGRKDERGLPKDALAVPLPAGAVAAYVHGDSLVLMGRPSSRSQR
jgi:hypothetical protein